MTMNIGHIGNIGALLRRICRTASTMNVIELGARSWDDCIRHFEPERMDSNCIFICTTCIG